MIERKLILAGIGGQGVVFATRVLSQAALLKGERVLASENHGMSQRGGSVRSHLRLGQNGAPLIRRGTADVLIAFDPTEALLNLLFLRPGGVAFVNGPNGLDPSVREALQGLGIGLFSIHADECAKQLGAPAAANLVLLGFAATRPDLGLSLDDLRAAVRSLGPGRAMEVNLRALEMGASLAQRELAGLGLGSGSEARP